MYFRHNPDEFLRRYVSMMKRGSSTTFQGNIIVEQSVFLGESAPGEVKSARIVVMVTVFLDSRGIIHIDYLEKERRMN